MTWGEVKKYLNNLETPDESFVERVEVNCTAHHPDGKGISFIHVGEHGGMSIVEDGK